MDNNTYNIIIDDNITNIPNNAHPRTYNLPTTIECGCILIGQGNEDIGKQRAIKIRTTAGGLETIESSHSTYDPLCYTITHPYADRGWTYNGVAKFKQLTKQNQIINFLHNNNNREIFLPIKYVTANEFYCYRFQRREQWIRHPRTMLKITRPNIMTDTLLYGGILFQQFVISCWLKIEEQRLQYIYLNQDKLKTELYQYLADAVRANESREAGNYIVLPSTFVGSKRHRFNSYQDAMAIVRKFGKPDIFITFTADPNWDEIKKELPSNMESYMCPDIVSRVFYIKLKELIHDIEYKLMFGKFNSQIHVIEFQKRGLPHSHLLLFLNDEDKLRTTNDFDNFICAEIPDPVLHPRLHALVIKHMIHTCQVGRCKQSVNSYCSKQFPKPLSDTTIYNDKSYPTYRRRNKYPYQRLNRDGTITEITDAYVVPYNPLLLLKYESHINIEIANSIKTVKYITKYIYKGHDKALVSIRKANENNNAQQQQPLIIDEIKSYQDCRYVGPMEAMWRIYGNYMQSKYPNVESLPVHLEGQHSVVYMEGNERDAVLMNQNAHTKLTEYFATVQRENTTPLTALQLGTHPITNIINPRANELKYQDFPSYYTFTDNTWKRRSKPHYSNTIGRLANVHPNANEAFYLRLLLTHTVGVKSFQHLKENENGQTLSTYKEVKNLFFF